MTKKDYELIAGVLQNRKHRELALGAEGEKKDLVFGVLDSLIVDFAEALENENPRFDMVRFIKACGAWRSYVSNNVAR